MVVVLLLGSTAGAGYYFARKKTTTEETSPAELATWLDEAKGLADNQEYTEAIARLGPELTTGYRDNAEALRLFAKSRAMIPSEDNIHLLDAIRVYRRAIVLEPNDRETAKELFYLYQVINEGEKAVEMGQVAIDNGETDFGFRLAQGEMLRQTRKFDAASAIARALIEEEPANLAVYELQLACMADQKLPEDEIYEFVAEMTSGEQSNAPTRDQLMLALAEIQGDKELASLLTRKVSVEPIGSTKQAIQIANRLARSNETTASLQILEKASQQNEAASLEIDLPLLYRYLQDSRFVDAQNLIENKFPAANERPEEVTIVEALASWLDEPTDDLTPMLERLRKSETLLARTWLLLFQKLNVNDTETLELVQIAKQATDTYPRSAYLQFFYGMSLETLGEKDMAIQTYRKAIRLAPRWGVARVQLADVLSERSDYRTAFLEATVSLRANSKFARGFEAVVTSSTGLVAQGDELPTQQLKFIIDAMKDLAQNAEDLQQKRLLNAITSRFEGQFDTADGHLREFLKNADTLEPKMVRVMRQLATDTKLVDSIDTSAEKTLGLTFRQLLDKAVELGKEDTTAGLACIDAYRVNGNSLPSDTRQLARAQYLTKIESSDAGGEWKRLLKESSGDLSILKSAFYTPALKNDVETRRSVLEKLKTATSIDGLTFRLAEIRLMLDEDDSDRTAAAAVLKLDEIIKETPRAVRPYSMMVEAYQRLKQPVQIVQILGKAVERGLNSPGIRLALAETLIELNDAGKAIPHAIAVQQDVRSGFLVRQRAVQVMLNANSYRLAAESIRKDLPEQCEDTDQHLAMFGAYALASIRSNEAFDAARLVGDLPRTKQRWFDLWLKLASDENLQPELAREWLSSAKNWLNDDDFDGHRRLSRAYRKLANRFDKKQNLGVAMELLATVLDSNDATTIDSMSQAGIHDALGDREKAIAIYDQVSQVSNASDQIRSIALNNSASLHLRTGATESAKERIQRAIGIESRPEFTDTLAMILAAEGDLQSANSLLQTAVADEPEEILLRVRFADTLQQVGQLEDAEKQIQEIKIRVRTAADTSLQIWQQIRGLEETQYRLSSAQEGREQTSG